MQRKVRAAIPNDAEKRDAECNIYWNVQVNSRRRRFKQKCAWKRTIHRKTTSEFTLHLKLYKYIFRNLRRLTNHLYLFFSVPFLSWNWSNLAAFCELDRTTIKHFHFEEHLIPTFLAESQTMLYRMIKKHAKKHIETQQKRIFEKKHIFLLAMSVCVWSTIEMQLKSAKKHVFV